MSAVVGTVESAGAGPPRRALALLDRAVGAVVIAIMALMVAIVTAQVFFRYMLNSSIDWAEEVSRLCFVWTIFLSIPLALARGGHIVMELVLNRIGPARRNILYRSMSVLSVGLMALVAYDAMKLTIENWDEEIPAIGLSGGLFFLPVAIGAAHSILHLIDIALSGEPRRRGIIE
jgi:TRAP-type transport system small permease protein